VAFTFFMPALIVFLCGAASGIFVVVVVSIRRGERTRFLSNVPEKHAGLIARRVLVGVRNDSDQAEGEDK
jgi:hypothetical protein